MCVQNNSCIIQTSDYAYSSFYYFFCFTHACMDGAILTISNMTATGCSVNCTQ